MEQAFAGFQRGLDAVIQTALTQFQNAQSKSRRNGTPIIFGEDGGDIHGKSFGDWLVQVAILGSHEARPQAKAAAQDRLHKVDRCKWKTARSPPRPRWRGSIEPAFGRRLCRNAAARPAEHSNNGAQPCKGTLLARRIMPPPIGCKAALLPGRRARWQTQPSAAIGIDWHRLASIGPDGEPGVTVNKPSKR
jgi:hypothetical protein